MAIERTFSMIKPDAVERNLVGKILAIFEENGLKIAGIRKHHMSLKEAQGFYAVHSARGFFGELTEYMSRSPTMLVVLEGENAVAKNRELMGATNPANAAPGTIRKLFAKSVGENSVHGSDSLENAKIEIAYWFRETELS